MPRYEIIYIMIITISYHDNHDILNELNILICLLGVLMYTSIFGCFKPFHGSFSVLSLCIFEETCIRRFMLSRMVFVSTPYTKVSVSYDRIIKFV